MPFSIGFRRPLGNAGFVDEEIDAVKRREEEKRLNAMDPVERWRQIQRAIEWAKEAMPPSEWKIQTRLKRESMALKITRGSDILPAGSGL